MQVHVYPKKGEFEFWHIVTDSGHGMSGSLSGRCSFAMPSAARIESYYIGYGQPSPSWRVASPVETEFILSSLDDDERDGL